MITFVYYILIASFVGALLMWLVYRPMLKRAQQTEERLRRELDAKAEQYLHAATERDRLDERLRAQQEKLEFQQKETAESQARQRIDFKNLAAEILEEKSARFKQTNRESLDALLKPFKDNITQFRERVEKIYSDENQQRGALRNEIGNLMELNRRITEETTNLTRALKGNSKVQGDWGETVLETILEQSNLTKGIHYTTQTNIKDASGNNLRPDFILNMPDGKRLVVDSKVSLTAYVDYTAARDEETRRRCLADHARSVRAHVAELGRVGYQQNVLGSPDFVIMFMPTESSFLEAMQADAGLWNEAYSKRVIVSSPANLTAILMVVHDLWKRDEQSKNSIAIAEAGAGLYDKFASFVETLESIGRGLGKVQENYDIAMKQLKTGSGNLIRRTENLRKLGVRATKSLPQQPIDYGEEANDEPSGS